jgi:hypothetical protein
MFIALNLKNAFIRNREKILSLKKILHFASSWKISVDDTSACGLQVQMN